MKKVFWQNVVILVLLPMFMIFGFQNCSKFTANEYDPLHSESGIFVEQPGSQTIIDSTPILVEVLISSEALMHLGIATSDMTYKWFFKSTINGGAFVELLGQTTNILNIPQFKLSNQGDYKLAVTVAGKTYETHVFNLTLREATNSCDVNDLSFTWPLRGERGKDWLITHYFDQDTTPSSLRDYAGGVNKDAITYDGHRGIDIAIEGFKSMDAGVPIYASDNGVVTLVHDGEFDRSKERNPGAQSNMVAVRSANGFITGYLHMKKDTVAVRVGDVIRTGDLLGYVGSSGDSSGPHLHIETRDCQGRSIDIMQYNLFGDSIAYKSPATLMDVYFRLTGEISQDEATYFIPQSTPSITRAQRNQRVYYSLLYTNIVSGSTIDIDFINPQGTIVYTINHTATSETINFMRMYRRWGGWVSLNTSAMYDVVFRNNNQSLKSIKLEITN